MRSSVALAERPGWLRAALSRIEAQSALVKRLRPGSADHRQATEVLLVLQDCLHAMTEAQAVIDQVRSRKPTLGEWSKRSGKKD